MANSTIPDLSDAAAITSAFGFPAADGLGNDVEVGAPLFKTWVGSVLRSIYVPAAAIRPSSSGGCAALALVETSANQPDISSLDFDATTAEYAQFWVRMPKSWNLGTITAAFIWSHASTTTNFGVRWGIQAVAISDGDTMAAAYGTAQEVTDTGGTTNTLYMSAATSAITIAGTPASQDLVAFRVYFTTTTTDET